MDRNRQQEEFNLAYVRAVASVGGYSVTRPDVDDDSVDLTICKAGGDGPVRSVRLDVQAKSLSGPTPTTAQIQYALKQKNYDDLRPTNVLVPRILVLMFVPPQVSDWLTQSEVSLSMRHCAYWVSLRGQPVTENETSTTVTLPRAQLFTVDALNRIMDGIASGRMP